MCTESVDRVAGILIRKTAWEMEDSGSNPPQ